MTQDSPGEVLEEVSDSHLISDYVNNGSYQAFETLVRRHYNTVHKRLLSLTHNHADADDLAQRVWLRILENLPTYKDNQKFPHFLNTIASNLVKDEWRKNRIRNHSSLDQFYDQGDHHLELADESEDLSVSFENRAAITHLVRRLIPNLPSKLRRVFLLKHESEYWDKKQPFHWQHVADLTSQTIDEAFSRFQRCRDGLLTGDLSSKTVEEEDKFVFLLWTQTQRPDKTTAQTESYLASLLGVPVNTFKTRYRSAVSQLTKDLEQWRLDQNT